MRIVYSFSFFSLSVVVFCDGIAASGLQQHLMAFVVSTSKSPTSVIGQAAGYFLGNHVKYVVLNRANTLSLFRVSHSASLEESVAHVQDFKMNCTIKCIHRVRIVDPITKQIARDLLFLLSSRYEVSIVALHANESEKLSMTTLFFWCATGSASHFINTVSCSSSECSETTIATPYVVYSVGDGDLHILDILAALGSPQHHSQQHPTYRSQLLHFFSQQTVSAIMERGRREFVIRGAFHSTELDVRSLSFGCNSDGNNVSLFVLYGDNERVHLSEYNFRTSQIVGGMSDKEQTFMRKGCVQSNVHPSSSLILVSASGVVCVGSQFITLIRSKGRPHSIELPSSLPTSAETSAAAFFPDGSLIVSTMAGTATRVRIECNREDLTDVRMPIVAHCKNMDTIPSCIIPISNSICLLPSSFEDTIVVDTTTWRSCVVIENCGPVLAMTVPNDSSGAANMVLASTGIERRGGISVLRSVMNLASQAVFTLPSEVERVFACHELIILLSESGSARYCNTNMRDLSTPTEMLPARGCLVDLHYHNEEYILVHCFGFVTCKLHENRTQLVRTQETLLVEGTQKVMFSAFYGGLLVVSLEDGAYHTQIKFVPSGENPWSLDATGCVSCITLSSSLYCIVGRWDSTISVVNTKERVVVGHMVLDSIPQSLCCVPSSGTILVSLTSGYLCETCVELILQQRLRHSFLLMNEPVQLCPLANKNLVVCLCDTPTIVIVTNEGCEVTGLTVDGGVSSCGSLCAGDSNKHVFFSKIRNTIHIGEIGGSQKLNRSFIPLEGTVTLLRFLLECNGVVLALRHYNRESIIFLPNSVLQDRWNGEASCRPLLELLDNEQSCFIECVELDLRIDNRSSEVRSEPAVLVGSGFLFRDEPKARSSRVMWFSRKQNDHLALMGEKELKGSLQCCCVIPNSSGLIAVGVSGTILLYQWSAPEQTFILREQLMIGLVLFSLHSYVLSESETRGIVAIDSRHGLSDVEVDVGSGTMKLVARESKLREAVIGVLLHNETALVLDRRENLFAVTKTPTSTRNDFRQFKLHDSAQIHVGQPVSCIDHGSFAPMTASSEHCNSRRLFGKGSLGTQIVFGTAYGGFGTVTPVGNVLYYVFRAMECAMATLATNGSFSAEKYRSVSSVSLSLNTRNQTRMSRKVRWVDSDTIEAYIGLQQQQRVNVLNVASKIAITWWPILNSLMTGEEGEKLDFILADEVQPASLESDDAREKCNDILAEAELPLIPFNDESMQRLLFDFRRLH